MQVEHPKDRDLPSGQSTDAGEQLTLHVPLRLGGHGAVQDEVDRVDARGQRRRRHGGKGAPVTLKHRIRHRAARRRPRINRGDYLPPFGLSDLQESVGGRGVAPLREDRVAFHHRERLPRRHFIEEGMGLVEETAKENPRAHGRAWSGLRPEPSTWRRAARTPPRLGPAPHRYRQRCG